MDKIDTNQSVVPVIDDYTIANDEFLTFFQFWVDAQHGLNFQVDSNGKYYGPKAGLFNSPGASNILS